jgi:ABC-type Mn2+/Zn2+ transport system ATPase subunit
MISAPARTTPHTQPNGIEPTGIELAGTQPTADSPRQRPIAIEVRGLTVRYREALALHDVTFTAYEGERIAVIGPNGAGKSTLIRAIMGLTETTSGSVHIAGGRKRLGYVAQHEGVDWSFPVTVYDVVMMGCTRDIGWLRGPGAKHRARVREALERTDLLALHNRPIGALSGGQRRRVFIARALAQQADILLLDEPFSGVDAASQGDIMNVLDRLNASGITLVLSTHDLELAFHRFDRVLALRHRVIACGPPDVVYTRETLDGLYGKRLLAWGETSALRDRLNVLVDEHGCENC